MRLKMKPHSILKSVCLFTLWVAFLYLLFPGSALGDDMINGIGKVYPEAMKAPEVSGPEIWKDSTQSLEARVQDLVRRMTLAEKTSQLSADAVAIPRLGIPAYSYRNECLHGKARSGVATVFPQAIGMAATWDAPLIREEADTIATEARAVHNDYTSQHNGESSRQHGLSFYAPNINLVRDPRWGRGQETYGEDPFLTSQLGVAFIRGLQGDNPKYIKAMAGAKHYAVHNGPEPLRTYFNATPSERDLYETYLPAFEAAVHEGKVGSVMGAYSALDGIPDCANPFLLTKILREQWEFKGFVVSDGGAIMENWRHHKYTETPEESAAVAVKAGCDLFSGRIVNQPRKESEVLGLLLKRNLLSEKEINEAVGRTMEARFRLGMFDPPSMVPWSKITIAQNDTPKHRALALKVARESIVLLKNNGLLPLDKTKIKHIAVIGANADSVPMLLGNYNGTPSNPVTILEGVKQVAGDNIKVAFETGCPLALKNDNSNKPTNEMVSQTIAAAKAADVVVYVGGIDASFEREGGGKAEYHGFLGGDRMQIELPQVQTELLKALHATGKPVVFVNCSGSAMAIPWEAENLPAIIQAWYPGGEGGRAVAEVLFGDVNPAGRLPVTFYRSTEDLPPFEDYSMANRTYRYFTGKPLFAFGYGLSYTKFEYSGAKIDQDTVSARDTMKITFKIKNTGTRDGDEVAQIYFRHVRSAVPQSKQALCGFTRILVVKGETKTITLDIPVQRFRYWDIVQKKYIVESGEYELMIGGASDDIRLRLPLKITGAP